MRSVLLEQELGQRAQGKNEQGLWGVCVCERETLPGSHHKLPSAPSKIFGASIQGVSHRTNSIQEISQVILGRRPNCYI